MLILSCYLFRKSILVLFSTSLWLAFPINVQCMKKSHEPSPSTYSAWRGHMSLPHQRTVHEEVTWAFPINVQCMKRSHEPSPSTYSAWRGHIAISNQNYTKILSSIFYFFPSFTLSPSSPFYHLSVLLSSPTITELQKTTHSMLIPRPLRRRWEKTQQLPSEMHETHPLYSPPPTNIIFLLFISHFCFAYACSPDN